MKTRLEYAHHYVERLFPGLPTAKYRNTYLLSAWIRWLHNDRDMELLAQQACFEQALEAVVMGLDLSYLAEYARSREARTRNFRNRNLRAQTQTVSQPRRYP